MSKSEDLSIEAKNLLAAHGVAPLVLVNSQMNNNQLGDLCARMEMIVCQSAPSTAVNMVLQGTLMLRLFSMRDLMNKNGISFKPKDVKVVMDTIFRPMIDEINEWPAQDLLKEGLK